MHEDTSVFAILCQTLSNEVNPAYSAVFQSDIIATYDAKEHAINQTIGIND